MGYNFVVRTDSLGIKEVNSDMVGSKAGSVAPIEPQVRLIVRVKRKLRSSTPET